MKVFVCKVVSMLFYSVTTAFLKNINWTNIDVT